MRRLRRVVQIISICAAKGVGVVEANSVFFHGRVGSRRHELSYVEGLVDHDVVNGVSAAEVKAKELQGH